MSSIFNKPIPKYIPRVFNCDPNEEGLPFLVKKYREVYNGKNENELQDLFMKVAMSNIDEMQKSLFSIQFAEPIVKGYCGVEPDILSNDFFNIMQNYSISSTIKQIENIKELIDYFPELSYAKKDIEEAYLEIKAKEEILELIKQEGPFFKKDLLSRLKYYPKLRFQENFIIRLIGHKVIQTRKKGKFIEYFI